MFQEIPEKSPLDISWSLRTWKLRHPHPLMREEIDGAEVAKIVLVVFSKRNLSPHIVPPIVPAPEFCDQMGGGYIMGGGHEIRTWPLLQDPGRARERRHVLRGRDIIYHVPYIHLANPKLPKAIFIYLSYHHPLLIDPWSGISEGPMGQSWG